MKHSTNKKTATTKVKTSSKALKVKNKHDLKTIAKKAVELKNLVVDGVEEVSDHVIELKNLTVDVKNAFFDLKDKVVDFKNEALSTSDDLQYMAHDLREGAAEAVTEIRYNYNRLRRRVKNIKDNTIDKITHLKNKAVKQSKKISRKILPTGVITSLNVPKKLKKIVSAAKSTVTVAKTKASAIIGNKKTATIKKKAATKTKKILAVTKKRSLTTTKKISTATKALPSKRTKKASGAEKVKRVANTRNSTSLGANKKIVKRRRKLSIARSS